MYFIVASLIHKHNLIDVNLIADIKVAEHSFQVPMPNLPLLLKYLYFGARCFASKSQLQKCLFSNFH